MPLKCRTRRLLGIGREYNAGALAVTGIFTVKTKRSPARLSTTVPRVLIGIFSLVLGLLAAGVRLSPKEPLEKAAESALNASDHSVAVQLYREALRRDDASPYRWADLAEALARAGNVADANSCFHRALKLGSGVPQIWLRHANFCFLTNQADEALLSAVHVLASVSEYDEILFHDFDQMLSGTAVVASSLEPHPRALRAWLAHLIQTK